MKSRIWFWTHSLLGVTAGLLLFIISWSGTCAVFSREIDWVLTPAVRAEHGGEISSWEALRQAVERRFPDGTIQSISAPWAPGFAADVLINTPDQDAIHAYVHPNTARVQGWTSFFNVQRFFRSFHMELFWGIQRWGYYLVGAVALVLLTSAITALTFYKRWWRGFFKLELKHGLRVALSDAHKLLGAWSLIFIVIIAVTGFWYLIKRLDGVFITLPHGEQYQQAIVEKTPTGAELSLDALVVRAHQASPGLDIRTIYPPRKPSELVRLEGFSGDFLASENSNQVGLNPADGHMLFVTRARELPPYFRWVESVDMLHTGRWGGLATRIAWFIFGLAVASMSLTGAFLHVKRQARFDHRLPSIAVAIAYLCIILALGLSVRGAIAEIQSYGPYVGDGQQFPHVDASIIAFLSIWILTLVAPLAAWARWVR
ncbi:MAG: PepSY-associated TM helix domain-containing protein [Vitreimonas sp.]